MSALAIYLLTAAGLLVAMELGFRAARLPGLRRAPEQRSQVGTVLAALLALLGFLLAFSFSIVESRFAARKALVLKEANAIGTAYLRTDFLPQEAASRSRALLRRYVERRTGAQLEDVPQVLREAQQVHEELWALSTRAARAQPGSIPLGLYIDSLNEVFDLHEERLTVAVRGHLPQVFVVLLIAGAALAIAILGFSAGEGGSRNLVATVPFILVLAALLSVVLDLDRPDVRIARVGQGAMEDLRRGMQGEVPEP